jgi:nucleoid-associated protein YgaU
MAAAAVVVVWLVQRFDAAPEGMLRDQPAQTTGFPPPGSENRVGFPPVSEMPRVPAPAPGPVATGGAEAGAAAGQPEAASLPRFDVRRVAADGGALVAGRAEPGSAVEIRVDDRRVAQVMADATGEFVAIFSLAPSSAPQVLSLAMVLADGREVVSPDVMVLAPRLGELAAVPDTGGAAAPAGALPGGAAELAVVLPEEPGDAGGAEPVVVPGAGDGMAQGEVAVLEAGDVADGGAAAPVEAGSAGIAPVAGVGSPQPGLSDGPGAGTDLAAAPPDFLLDRQGQVRVLDDAGGQMANVVLDAISYDSAGGIAVTGRATQAEGGVRLYLDNRPVAAARARGGVWSADLSQIAAGVYTLRVDEIDGAGQVVSRFETPFLREEPAAVARLHGPAGAQAGEQAEELAGASDGPGVPEPGADDPETQIAALSDVAAGSAAEGADSAPVEPGAGVARREGEGNDVDAVAAVGDGVGADQPAPETVHAGVPGVSAGRDPEQAGGVVAGAVAQDLPAVAGGAGLSGGDPLPTETASAGAGHDADAGGDTARSTLEADAPAEGVAAVAVPEPAAPATEAEAPAMAEAGGAAVRPMAGSDVATGARDRETGDPTPPVTAPEASLMALRPPEPGPVAAPTPGVSDAPLIAALRPETGSVATSAPEAAGDDAPQVASQPPEPGPVAAPEAAVVASGSAPGSAPGAIRDVTTGQAPAASGTGASAQAIAEASAQPLTQPAERGVIPAGVAGDPRASEDGDRVGEDPASGAGSGGPVVDIAASVMPAQGVLALAPASTDPTVSAPAGTAEASAGDGGAQGTRAAQGERPSQPPGGPAAQERPAAPADGTVASAAQGGVALSGSAPSEGAPSGNGQPGGPRVALITVQPGQSLWRISHEHYGEGARYVQILRANRSQIRNPNLIYPGQIFTLPD